MKQKEKFPNENHTSNPDLFRLDFSSSPKLAVLSEKSLEKNPSKSEKSGDEILDKLLTAIKWIFLFIPGVTVLHLAMMGTAVMFFYREFEALGLLGLVAFGTFLIMFSFGKMGDLKYLKSVLMILGFSLINAIFYDVLAYFIKGDFLGFYIKLTLPLMILIGYLSKKYVDKEAEDSK